MARVVHQLFPFFALLAGLVVSAHRTSLDQLPTGFAGIVRQEEGSVHAGSALRGRCALLAVLKRVAAEGTVSIVPEETGLALSTIIFGITLEAVVKTGLTSVVGFVEVEPVFALSASAFIFAIETVGEIGADVTTAVWFEEVPLLADFALLEPFFAGLAPWNPLVAGQAVPFLGPEIGQAPGAGVSVGASDAIIQDSCTEQAGVVFQEICIVVATSAGIFVGASQAAVDVVVATVAVIFFQVGDVSSAGGALVFG